MNNMNGHYLNDKTITNSYGNHRQLPIELRKELAKYATKHGINVTAKLYGKHYSTVKRWYNNYLSNGIFTNLVTTPLTSQDHEYLDSLSHLIGSKSIREIKKEYSLPFSIDTLAKYYKRKNIPIEEKYLLILKCPDCQRWLRAINVFFGRPRIMCCPICGFHKLNRQEYLRIPFYNPRQQDYFFNRSLLSPIDSDYKESVLSLLKMPKNLKCLLVYNTNPRKHNRIHLIKYFEKIGDTTIPVTYCSVSFVNINKREIYNPRSHEIVLDLICQRCQLPYYRDFKKNGDKFPKIVVKSLSKLQIALELFIIAQKYNNKTAYTLLGLSKKEFYKLKKQYAEQFDTVRRCMGSEIL